MAKNVLTPVARVIYPSVFEPAKYRDQDPDKTPQYEITLIFSKDTDLTEMKKIAREALQEKFGSRIPAKLRSPFVKVADHNSSEQLIAAGLDPEDVTVKFKSYDAPGVVGPRKEKILKSSGEIYHGCYARVSTYAKAWDHMGGKGVSLKMGNVQKCKDGERITLSGTRESADVEFDAIEVDESNVAYDELEGADLL